jgi:quinol monooxygenase YgiN
MATQDKCCTIAPYFKVRASQLGAFKIFCERFMEITKSERGCLYYGFAFDGDLVHCREGYVDADALLTHVKRVGPTIQEALKISELVRLEVHGPESELAKLRAPLADLKPQFFTLEYGSRRGARI